MKDFRSRQSTRVRTAAPLCLRCAACCLLGLLAGCAAGPNYKRPALDVPSHFRGDVGLVSSNTLAELPWWDFFQDPHLKQLIGLALTNNYDVRIAVARVEQARAVVAQNRALFFPQLNYAAQVGRSRNATPTGP